MMTTLGRFSIDEVEGDYLLRFENEVGVALDIKCTLSQLDAIAERIHDQFQGFDEELDSAEVVLADDVTEAEPETDPETAEPSEAD